LAGTNLLVNPSFLNEVNPLGNPEAALAFRYTEKQRKQVIMKMNFFIINFLFVTMVKTGYYSLENDVFLHFEFK
jgi:hypothetical protein